MINSLLMLGSTYNKSKKLNIIFAISWIIFMLIGSNLRTGLIFTVFNFVAFGIVFGLGKLFKGKYSNKVVAISSILIWSIVIDIICYFLYPQFAVGQNLLGYISNGVIFNYRYILSNAVIVGIITFVEYAVKLKINIKSKESAVYS